MLGARRCDQHRGALLDFADTREIRPATAAALEHLGRCPACVDELEITALAIVGLRRLYEVRAVEPPGDSWTRLRSRIDRPRVATYSLRSPLLGSLVSVVLIATIGVQSIRVEPNTEPGRPTPFTIRDKYEPTVRMRDSSWNLERTVTVHWPFPDGRLITPYTGKTSWQLSRA
jgi:predicted anti-sigma-YlaC factor YlaD